MRAVVQDRYGPPETLRLVDLPDPDPGPGEVLVRVTAASLNPADWHVLRGDPRIARLGLGLRRPRRRVAGQDGAGVVVAVGRGVDDLAVGDRVAGYLHGAWAELSTADPARVARVPDGIDLADAAALPMAATTGLRAMTAGRVGAGQSVLVVGASGGVGTAALQVAVHRGAEVTAVCSAANADLVRSWGAVHVVDHRTTDLGQLTERFDVVLDNVGGRSLRRMRQLLTPRGTLLVNGGGGPTGKVIGSAGAFAAAALLNPFVRHRLVPVPPTESGIEVAEVLTMVAAGTLRPVVSDVLGLEDAAAGLRRVESGHTRGKMVLRIG